MGEAWLHESTMSNSEAGELALGKGTGDGTYFVRPREGHPNNYVLCVVYKGKPTHHLIAKNEDGLWAINRKTYGDHSSLNELITALQGSVPKWPVPLKHAVEKSGSVGGSESTADYHHQAILPKEESAALVLGQGTGDGTFLISNHASGGHVLCVVYKGKPTHHLISNVDGSLVVNKKSYVDASTLDELVTGLSKPGVPKWPVPLAHPVPPQNASSAAAAAAAPAPTPTPQSADKTDSVEGYYHPKTLDKESSSALVLEAGGGDGTFLVYDHTSGGKVLCVVYKGKPTHHLITVVDGVVLVNKKDYANASSLAQLISALGKPGVPKWPVPLTHPIAPPKEDPEAAAKAAAEAEEARQREEEARLQREAEEAEAQKRAAEEAAAEQERKAAEEEAARAAAEVAAEEERKRQEAEAAEAQKAQEIAEEEARQQREAAEAEERRKKEEEEEAKKKKAEEEAAAKAEAERVRREALLVELNTSAIQPLYNSGSIPDEAQATLTAAREEPLTSVNDLQALLQEVESFKQGGVVSVQDAWAELSAASAEPPLGLFLDTFDLESMKKRRALVDPEYAAEQRAKEASEAAAAKRREDQESAAAKAAQEKAEAEAAAKAAAEQAAADEEMMAKLPKWRQEKLKRERAAKAAADEAAAASVKPAWKATLLDEKRAKQEQEAATDTAHKKASASLLIAREEKERREREELEERQRQLAAEKQAADDARREQQEAEQERVAAEERAQREEEEKIAAMPAWKRAVYLKRKEAAAKQGGSPAEKPSPPKQFALADGVMALLAKRREALAEQEAEAERKANAAKASDTVNRAWTALGAGTAKEAPVNQAPATSEDALKATVGMFKMKKLQQIQEGEDKKKKKGTWGRSKITMLESLEASEELEAATKAAAMIARVWRAKVARRKLAELKKAKEAAEAEAAATRIQASFRGHKARKEAEAAKARQEAQKRADAEAAIRFAEQQALLQAIAQKRQELALRHQALAAQAEQEAKARAQAQQAGNSKTKKKSTRHKTSANPSRKPTKRRSGPAPVQVASSKNPTSSEKLRRIAQRAAELEAQQVQSGSVAAVDSTSGLYIVDGVYLNQQGTLAHTAV